MSDEQGNLNPPVWDDTYQRYYLRRYDDNQKQWVFDFWLDPTPQPQPQPRPVTPKSASYEGDSGVFLTPPPQITAQYAAGQVAGPAHVSPSALQNTRERNPRRTLKATYPNRTGDKFERVDKSYQVQPKQFFFEGRVFAVIMNETAGSTSKDITDYNSARSYTVAKYQDNIVHTQVRRFVVVRARPEFCYACPIFTYGGRGTTKGGVRPNEHSIAYSWGQQPQLLQNEVGITKKAIEVVMTSGETLHAASRIYFGIHHPIQYNVKVKEIGYLQQEFIPKLIGNWKEEDGKGETPLTGLAEEDEDEAVLAEYNYDAEYNQDGFHPQHNPHGYHPRLNPHGYHEEEAPFAYHPVHNGYGYHDKLNRRGYHPTRNPLGYHPTMTPSCFHPEHNKHGYHEKYNPQGYHPVLSPYCWHPEYELDGFHKVHNKHGFHPTLHKTGYHPVHNPLVYNAKRNPWAYHKEKNPDGFHPSRDANARAYHPLQNPHSYHPTENVYGYNPAEPYKHAYHPRFNPHGYHWQLKPHGFHPDHNPDGYHPTYNPEAAYISDGSGESSDSDDEAIEASPSTSAPASAPINSMNDALLAAQMHYTSLSKS